VTGPPSAASAGGPSAERAGAARSTMEALSASTDVFATFFEQAAIGLALADLSGLYVRVNPVYAELLGRAPEDLVGVAFASVVHPDDRPDADSAVALLEGAKQAIEREQRYLHPDGRMRWVLHGVTVVPGDHGRPAWFAVSAQDITERRRAEQELRELAAVLSERAVRDPLTGLANRTLLLERVRAALARDARTQGGTGLLFLDLDGFKAVNDRYGHELGDEVLRRVGARFTSVVRPSDTVARIGGDEFVVLVEAKEPADLQPVVARLAATFTEPLHVALGPGEVGVSIGTAWVRGGDSTPAELLRRADADMYRHKRDGR
jgi:diguanylate cyclase (GGDEF)-like protein/PAS domain S-box-containing protein